MDQIHQRQGDVIAAARRSAESGQDTLLLHVVNTAGGWGRGFTGVLSYHWPAPEKLYRAWAQVPAQAEHSLGLGKIQAVRVQPQLHVVNCCAQLGYSRPGAPAFRLAAMELCLHHVRERYPQHHYYLPRIGAGLGGETWSRVAAMLERMLGDCPFVAVYSL